MWFNRLGQTYLTSSPFIQLQNSVSVSKYLLVGPAIFSMETICAEKVALYLTRQDYDKKSLPTIQQEDSLEAAGP